MRLCDQGATMTSRERVRRVVNFQIPDRVPIDLGGMKASGIAPEALFLPGTQVKEQPDGSWSCSTPPTSSEGTEISD
jgi:hypothetical protein